MHFENALKNILWILCYDEFSLRALCVTETLPRRLRIDQIEVFKIVNGYEDIDRNMFFKLKEGSRTG